MPNKPETTSPSGNTTLKTDFGKSKDGKILIYCQHPGCLDRAKVRNKPNPLIGKIMEPFNKAWFRCGFCRDYTIAFGSLSGSPNSLLAEKIENPSLRRTLFGDKP